MENKNIGQIILAVLVIIYLLVGYKITPDMAVMINNMGSTLILLLLVVVLFVFFHPILGILGLFVILQIIFQAYEYSSSYSPSGFFGEDLKPFYPTEKLEKTNLNLYHQFPYTLEQEVVKNMTTLKQNDKPDMTYSFKPVLDDTFNASFVNQQNELFFGVPKLQG